MSFNTVRAGLESRLKTWAAARVPPLSVAWENVKFDPPANKPYLRVDFLPASTISHDLEGRHREWNGIMQVSVFLPAGDGPFMVDGDILPALDALFSPGVGFVYQGVRIRALQPVDRAAALPQADRTMIPLSVRYHAQTYLG